jgi:hypothetical protein
LECRLEKVTDEERIAAFRSIVHTGACRRRRVQLAGRVPTVGALKELLVAAASAQP